MLTTSQLALVDCAAGLVAWSGAVVAAPTLMRQDDGHNRFEFRYSRSTAPKIWTAPGDPVG